MPVTPERLRVFRVERLAASPTVVTCGCCHAAACPQCGACRCMLHDAPCERRPFTDADHGQNLGADPDIIAWRAQYPHLAPPEERG